MNKDNKILIAILTFIVVCVMGYALFSETITVTGTATATGSFEVETICMPGFDSEILSALEVTSDDIGEGAYRNDMCEVNDNTISMKAELLYPSASRYFTIKVKNTGSMDSFIKTNDLVEIDEELEIYDLKTDILKQTIKEGTSDWHDARVKYARVESDFIAIKTSDDSIIYDFETYFNKNIVYKNASGDSYLKISPGETLYLIVNIYWASGLSAQDEYSLNIGTKTFKFEQQTSDMILSTELNECLFGC